EYPARGLHGTQRLCIEYERHVVDLVAAHAVLARDAAAGSDARRHDVAAGIAHAFRLAVIAAIEADVGMEIPVTGMKDVADTQPIKGPDFVDSVAQIEVPDLFHAVEHIGQG